MSLSHGFAAHIFLTFCCIFVLLSGVYGQQSLPLDPLNPAEIEIAANVARADLRVRKELGTGRQQLIQVQFLAQKADSDLKTPDGRYARVVFYRYDTDQGVNVVVDVGERSVRDIVRIDGRAVPLALEEIGAAFQIALLNGRVKTLLGPGASEFGVGRPVPGNGLQNRVEGLRVVATSPHDQCYRHRCIELYFRKPGGYITTAAVIVDLSAQTVKIANRVR